MLFDYLKWCESINIHLISSHRSWSINHWKNFVKGTTFYCAYHTHMMTHNPTADFPRVRIKNTFRVKMCFVQIVMIVFEMWKSEWSGMCDLKKVLVKVVWPCDSFLILLWLCAVVVILRTIYITRKNEQRKAADDARCEKSGWVK